MYPGLTDFLLKQYEKALRRPYCYLLIDLKTRDDCRPRTNVLPGEEGFKAGVHLNLSEILVSLKRG